jgi:hypothetical protein
VSTANISATLPLSYSCCRHFHPIQNIFEVCFSPQIFSKSLGHPQNKETELKSIEKEREKKRKRKGIEKKRGAPKVSHDEGMHIFRKEKIFQLQIFLCEYIFSLPFHLNPSSKLL